MGDATKLKKARTLKLSQFTKRVNLLTEFLLDADATLHGATEAKEKVEAAYEALEDAHEAYFMEVEDHVINAEGDYMKVPSESHLACQKTYSKFRGRWEKGVADQAEVQRMKILNEKQVQEETAVKAANDVGFNKTRAEFAAGVATFKAPCDRLVEMENDEVAYADYRKVVNQVGGERSRLQGLVSRLSAMKALETGVLPEVGTYQKEVEDVYQEHLAQALRYLKDAPDTTVPSRGGSRSDGIKREAISLPKFSGKEATAYLEYPVWRINWNLLIEAYPETVRATILFEHLDAEARAKLVGLESNYTQALCKMKDIYGNKLKVVQCCLAEISNSRAIKGPTDYGGLVQYSQVIDQNYKRLVAIDEAKELSNATVSNELVQRLPSVIQDRYMDHIMDLGDAARSDPLPHLIKWLEGQKKKWEMQEASRPVAGGRSQKSLFADHEETFHGDSKEDGAQSFPGTCHGCDKKGHRVRDCPDKKARENEPKPEGRPVHKKTWCAFHISPPLKHYTTSCTQIRKLPVNERLALLERNGDCPLCCGDHAEDKCTSTRKCGGERKKSGCGTDHSGHELFCENAKVFTTRITVVGGGGMPGLETHEEISCHVKKLETLLPVMRVSGTAKYKLVSVLWDPGSTCSFVREAYAKAMGFPCRKQILSVSTVNGDSKIREGLLYTCHMEDLNGIRHTFEAHGLESVTSRMGKIDLNVMKILFPNVSHFELSLLQRLDQVDYLIGFEHPSWHPIREVRAENGGDLWVLRSRFGTCLGGSHPTITERLAKSYNLFIVNHVIEDGMIRFANVVKNDFAKECAHSFHIGNAVKEVDILNGQVENSSVMFVGCSGDVEGYDSSIKKAKMQAVSHSVKTVPLSSDMFFQLESLGTEVVPKCAGCQCRKCPVPGSQYSFKEQQQLDLIRKLLSYDAATKKWTALLPWIVDKAVLPNNYGPALKSLVQAEKSLRKRGWGKVYGDQVHEMVKRKAAVKLSKEYMKNWEGVSHYLPHLIVQNPGSSSTPVRLCFDASRVQNSEGICLNNCLAKGPDGYLNSLVSVVLSFRLDIVAAKGDIRKFYHATLLVEGDANTQRFLWRDMESEREPDVFMVVVNNVGIRPSGTIATCVLENTADVFKERYPKASEDLKKRSYVDDVMSGAANLDMAMQRTKEIDEILEYGGMQCKKWFYSYMAGEDLEIGMDADKDGGVAVEKVLGLMWSPATDVFRYKFRLNFSTKMGKLYLDPHITLSQFLANPPTLLTRRQVLSQVAAIYDPLSLLTPVILQAKLLLRKSWGMATEKIGWDDPLPPELVKEWVDFFIMMFEIEDVTFDRSLTPSQETVGLPELVIFSDGAMVSYGVCAYIRWRLAAGGFWCRLIIAKGKIAPKFRATIPRMELCGAVLQVRVEKFILEEVNLPFGQVHHLTDSSTVLGYLHKDNNKFKPYEGVRISEVQSKGKYVDGVLQDWAWIKGTENPADMATKPVRPRDIGSSSIWQNGPAFLYTEREDWPVKTSFSMEALPEEITTFHSATVCLVTEDHTLDGLLAKCSTLLKLLRITALVLRIGSMKDISGVAVKGLEGIVISAMDPITAGEMQRAKLYWIQTAQATMAPELERSIQKEGQIKVVGDYKGLAPKKDEKGVWRVGTRMQNYVPFTRDHKAPVILPYFHKLTTLLMIHAHKKGHGGQERTVATFRQEGFWTVRTGVLAKKVKNSCILCRIADKILLTQPLGPFVDERFLEPMAWGRVELDLMGPFACRGETNPRTTVKIWGMVIEDVNSGAVHADIVVGYSANAVLAALRRFGWLRGWPALIHSDPGSQLESAGGRLESWWESFGTHLQSYAGNKNFKWSISPANSPWRQGKVERRIGCIKRLVKIALGETRVTQSELQTILMEAAGMANERPLTLGPVKQDGSYTIITPNLLMMGRSTITPPDDMELGESLSYKERYRIICQVTHAFWCKWVQEVSPKLVDRKKWHAGSLRQLRPGDLVMICDKTQIKGKYRLAVVSEVKVSKDGKVRSAILTYFAVGTGGVEKSAKGSFQWKDGKQGKLKGKEISVSRSIQRLSLILSIEEQEGPLEVHEHLNHISVERQNEEF